VRALEGVFQDEEATSGMGPIPKASFLLLFTVSQFLGVLENIYVPLTYTL
jgi:hypothetical protein